MGLQFFHLDEITRPLMLKEIDADETAKTVYYSNYLTEDGKLHWLERLRHACLQGSDDTLAAVLKRYNAFKDRVERKKPKGGSTLVAVPHTAAQTLSEARFNFYYIRAVCIRAKDEKRAIIVYRAKAVEVERESSILMIGKPMDADHVLTVLRETQGIDPAIDIPLPNSGLSMRMI